MGCSLEHEIAITFTPLAQSLRAQLIHTNTLAIDDGTTMPNILAAAIIVIVCTLSNYRAIRIDFPSEIGHTRHNLNKTNGDQRERRREREMEEHNNKWNAEQQTDILDGLAIKWQNKTTKKTNAVCMCVNHHKTIVRVCLPLSSQVQTAATSSSTGRTQVVIVVFSRFSTSFFVSFHFFFLFISRHKSDNIATFCFDLVFFFRAAWFHFATKRIFTGALCVHCGPSSACSSLPLPLPNEHCYCVSGHFCCLRREWIKSPVRIRHTPGQYVQIVVRNSKWKFS